MKPLPCPRPLRRPSLIPLAFAAALFGAAPAAWSKLPPPSAEVQAKAAEAKARAAHADKVAAYQTCKSMDHVVGVYQDALRKAVQDPATPDARVKELHAKAADARAAVMLEHRDMEREFVALLTPDQKSAYEQQRQLGGPRGRGRRHGGWGFGGGSDGGRMA